jgi:hypothetical protein
VKRTNRRIRVRAATLLASGTLAIAFVGAAPQIIDIDRQQHVAAADSNDQWMWSDRDDAPTPA